jgi:hypothetical protein
MVQIRYAKKARRWVGVETRTCEIRGISMRTQSWKIDTERGREGRRRRGDAPRTWALGDGTIQNDDCDETRTIASVLVRNTAGVNKAAPRGKQSSCWPGGCAHEILN